MRLSLIVICLMLIPELVLAQVKLITPGEHLGYQFESVDAQNELVMTNIQQGEQWAAIYVEEESFSVKMETIRWDTSQNFMFLSDSAVQPMFYVQGIDNVASEGLCKSFTWDDFMQPGPLRWEVRNQSFTILSASDARSEELEAYKSTIIQTDDPVLIFRDVPRDFFSGPRMDESIIVPLYWTGDLNQDGEPDFLLGVDSHHEMPILELILSDTSSGKTKWKRVARFTEWS